MMLCPKIFKVYFWNDVKHWAWEIHKSSMCAWTNTSSLYHSNSIYHSAVNCSVKSVNKCFRSVVFKVGVPAPWGTARGRYGGLRKLEGRWGKKWGEKNFNSSFNNHLSWTIQHVNCRIHRILRFSLKFGMTHHNLCWLGGCYQAPLPWRTLQQKKLRTHDQLKSENMRQHTLSMQPFRKWPWLLKMHPLSGDPLKQEFRCLDVH